MLIPSKVKSVAMIPHDFTLAASGVRILQLQTRYLDPSSLLLRTSESPGYGGAQQRSHAGRDHYNAPVPDQQMERILMNALKLQHGYAQTTGHRAEHSAHGGGRHRSPPPNQEPKQR